MSRRELRPTETLRSKESGNFRKRAWRWWPDSGCVVARNREGDLRALVGRLPQLIGIGIDEGTAAVVRGSALEVLGDSKLAVFDARRNPEAATAEWLQPGERWDLVAGRRD